MIYFPKSFYLLLFPITTRSREAPASNFPPTKFEEPKSKPSSWTFQDSPIIFLAHNASRLVESGNADMTMIRILKSDLGARGGTSGGLRFVPGFVMANVSMTRAPSSILGETDIKVRGDKGNDIIHETDKVTRKYNVISNGPNTSMTELCFQSSWSLSNGLARCAVVAEPGIATTVIG